MKPKRSLDEKWLLFVSTIVRLLFIAFGEWQDAHMEVPYTDIDYHVFSDAAALVTQGRSPFDRETYRYSPLLAYMLAPNTWIHPAWGKVLFSAADILAGHLIYEVLRLQGFSSNKSSVCAAVWLFNPFTFTVATRGNCESLVCCIILRIIYDLLTGHLLESAILYGLVVHFRIYPIIYIFAILIVLDSNFTSTQTLHSELRRPNSELYRKGVEKLHKGFHPTSSFQFMSKLFNRNRVIFGVVSGGIFFLLQGVFYFCYGDKFLHEALLYHLTRTDPRHNFSIYFYHIYLHHGHPFSLFERLLSFVPQFLVQSVLTCYYAKDIPFCFFIQTVAFVAFNKVITAQYFVWFFCVLPLILPWTRMRLRWKGIMCMVLWTAAQLHWLMWGYALEFQGKNVFLELWLASIAFFAANVSVLSAIIWHHDFHDSLGDSQKFLGTDNIKDELKVH